MKELMAEVFCNEIRERALIAKGHPSSTISSYEPISGNDPFYTPWKHIKPLVNLWFSVF